MSRFFKFMSRFGKSKQGATAVEYAMIVGLVAAATYSTVYTFGGNVKNVFNDMATSMGNYKVGGTPVK